MQDNKSVGIIGAGITGLTAANYLHKKGISFTLFESEAKVGGRVQTDKVDGFLLDRGFQVFLTGYPEAKRLLNYESLDLKPILPGAILLGNKKRAVWDVFRIPSKAFETIFSGVASPKDMVLLWKLRNWVKRLSVDEIFSQKEKTTATFLKDYGFSKGIIDLFFKPFYSGIFLETELHTSNRMFLFVFKMFAENKTAIPAKGMQEIPNQLAANLPKEAIHLEEAVLKIEQQTLITNKDTYQFDYIVDTRIPVAKEASEKSNGTWNFYFSAPESPLKMPAIALNSGNKGCVNSICVMSDVSSSYASNGQSLVSVSVVFGDEYYQKTEEQMVADVRGNLAQHFPEAKKWHFVKSYCIPHALPIANAIQQPEISDLSFGASNYLAVSDYRAFGSLNAAMQMGRLAAEKIIAN